MTNDMFDDEARKLPELCDDPLAMCLIADSIKYRQAVANRWSMYDFDDMN
jgi:hypothetical protein